MTWGFGGWVDPATYRMSRSSGDKGLGSALTRTAHPVEWLSGRHRGRGIQQRHSREFQRSIRSPWLSVSLKDQSTRSWLFCGILHHLPTQLSDGTKKAPGVVPGAFRCVQKNADAFSNRTTQVRRRLAAPSAPKARTKREVEAGSGTTLVVSKPSE